jgi:hypothetical protein
VPIAQAGKDRVVLEESGPVQGLHDGPRFSGVRVPTCVKLGLEQANRFPRCESPRGEWNSRKEQPPRFTSRLRLAHSINESEPNRAPVICH